MTNFARPKLYYMKKITLLVLSVLSFSGWMSAQETTIRGFANIDYNATSKGKNSYILGEYDQYITSKVTDRISFLGEAVISHNGTDFGVDLERCVLKYEINDKFYVRAGKFHAPIGFWNNAYHHGTVIQPTISRPLAVRFEDDGGLLQIHETGLWLAGDNIGKLGFGYDFVLSNGIGATPISDNNSSKAVTATIRFNPIEPLKFGVSGYFDNISAFSTTSLGEPLLGTTGTTVGHDLTHQNLSGFVSYNNNKLQVIGEYYHIQNKNDVVGNKNTQAGFVYAGYKVFGEWTPYTRFDFINTQAGDIYYMNQNTTMITGGLRYDFSFLSNLKIEYAHYNAKNIADNSRLITDNVRIQFSLGF